MANKVQQIHATTDDTPAATSYQCPFAGKELNWDATEANRQILAPSAGTLRYFIVRIDNAPGGVNSHTFDIRIGGVSSLTLTATLAGDITVLPIIADQAVSVGGLVAIRHTQSGAPAAPGNIQIVLGFEPTVAGQYWLGGSVNYPGGTVDSFHGLSNTTSSFGGVGSVDQFFPLAGTVDNFHEHRSAAPGVSVPVTHYKNGAATALTMTFGAADVDKADTVNSYTVAAGDTGSINFDQTSGTGGIAFYSARYTPTDTDKVPVMGNCSGLFNSTATWYADGARGSSASTTRSLVAMPRLYYGLKIGGYRAKIAGSLADDLVLTVAQTDTDSLVTGTITAGNTEVDASSLEDTFESDAEVDMKIGVTNSGAGPRWSYWMEAIDAPAATTPFELDLSGSILPADRILIQKAGTTTVGLTGGLIDINDPGAAGNGGSIELRTRLPITQSGMLVLTVSRTSGTNNDLIHVLDQGNPRLLNNSGDQLVEALTRMVFGTVVHQFSICSYWDSVAARIEWNETGAAWQAAFQEFARTQDDDFYTYILEIDGTNAQFRWHGVNEDSAGGYTADQGLSYQALTDWVLFSDTQNDPITEDLILAIGKFAVDNTNAERIQVKRLNWYPDTATDAMILNGGTGAGLGEPKRMYRYTNTARTLRGPFVHEDRSTIVLAVGGGGSWDEQKIKNLDELLVGTTVRELYTGFDISSNFQIGGATCPNEDLSGTHTKEAGNPLIARAAGTNRHNVNFARMVHITNNTEAGRDDQVVFTGHDNLSVIRIHYSDGTWPSIDNNITELLGPGSGGADDEGGVHNAIPLHLNGLWYIFHSALKTTGGNQYRIARTEGAALLRNCTVKHGTIVEPQANGTGILTANPAAPFRVMTVDTTTGMTAGSPVVTHTNTTTQVGVNRIHSVDSGTQVTLEHGAEGLVIGSYIRMLDACRGLYPTSINKFGSTWHIQGVAFFDWTDIPLSGGSEKQVEWTAASDADLLSGNWTMGGFVGHTALTGDLHGHVSRENGALLRQSTTLGSDNNVVRTRTRNSRLGRLLVG